MNIFKKALILILTLSLLLPVFASCDKKDENKDIDKDRYKYDDLTRETAADCIPENYSLDNESIGIFYHEPWMDSVLGDNETTDLIFSKIYERNRSVEERLSVKLDFQESGTTAWQDTSEVLKLSIQSMSSAFDVVFAANNMVIQQKLFNYFHNLNDANYIDVNERWWYTDAIMELSVDNYNFRFMYGDISINTLGATGAMYYNKDLYEQHLSPTKDRDDLYIKVLEGKWTFEEYDRMIRKSHIEKGGDGSNDIYGYSLFGSGEEILFFQEASAITMYTRNEQGMPVLDFKNDKSIEFTNALYSLLYENPGAWIFYPNRVSERAEHADDFPNNKVFFLLGNLNTALNDNMREMKSDFGILPYPKWDEEQELYRSLLHNSTALVACPISSDIDRVNEEVSAVIEALASESYRHVAVTYYETALKTAYNRDDYSAQMIDIITAQHDTVKSTLTKNFIYEYSWSLGGMGNLIKSLMSAQSKNFVSEYDSKYVTFPTYYNELIEQYLKGTI